MPLPLLLILPALGTAAAAGGRVLLRRYLRQHKKEIEEWAMKNALEAVGLPDLIGGDLTRESFTASINKTFLAGHDLQLTNLFDRAAVDRDVTKYAMKKAATDLGISLESDTVDGMRDALGKWSKAKVKAEIEAGGGELMNTAKDMQSEIEKIALLGYGPDGEPPEPPGLLMTKEAISNRERQARYRASHRKHWEPRG